MGLGWQVIDIDGEKIVDHSGSHALVFYLPQNRTGAVIFTNGENGQKVIHDIVGILYANQVFLATLN